MVNIQIIGFRMVLTQFERTDDLDTSTLMMVWLLQRYRQDGFFQ